MRLPFAGNEPSAVLAQAEAPRSPAEILPNARFPTNDIRFSANGLRFPTNDIRFATDNVRFPTARIAQAQRSGRELRFRVTADVLFDFDRAELRPQAEGVLRDVLRQIQEQARNPSIRIEGHTDSLGADAYNDALSLRRAESVRRFMAGAGGAPARAMEVQGLGKRRPVAPNTTPAGADNPEGRQQNRRVEIVATAGG